ncbi:MAG: hypothetical protein ABIH59_01765 [archaeon]
MNKKIFSVFVFLLVFSIGFTLAAQGDGVGNGSDGNSQGNGGDGTQQGDNQLIGGDRDEHGCLGPAGYTWNESEQKCVREWETGEARYQEQIQTRVQEGTHTGEGGQMLKIQTQANNRIRLEVGGVSVDCDCEMNQEKIQNRTKLSVKMSNGKNAEIKIMPNTASEKALERLRLKVCSEENGCAIELKEVGSGEQTKLAYELKTQRKAKFLGIFGTKMQVKAQIHAENGELIKIQKPWWAFLASEPAEE